MVWFVGAPVSVAALVFGAVRLRRPEGSAPAARSVDDDDASFTLAPTVRADGGPDADASPAATASPVAGAEGTEKHAVSDAPVAPADLLQPRTVVARLRQGVQSIVRRRRGDEPDDALEVPRPDVLSALHAERDAYPHVGSVEPAAEPLMQVAAPVAVPVESGNDAGTTWVERVRDNVTPLFPLTAGHGIVELESDLPDEERPIVGQEWGDAVSAREVSLRATLDARDAALAEDQQRQAEADTARHQQELERIAVAEEARVRSEARARRWFVRLDADLDAPTIAQRMTLVGTLGIRASWAGKLLREAFAQEEEARVRARIIGALVAGDHLEVAEPFERAFAQGGIERGAVWEALKPRSDDAPWIATLLAPLHEPMTAA
jgi:hypothetical protein